MTDVKNQILREYPHKIELHAHTYPASECSKVSAEELVLTYREERYSGIALTNHFYPWQPRGKKAFEQYVDTHIKEFEKTKTFGEKTDIKIYFGLEFRFEEGMNDYLVYGLSEDFIRNALSPKMKTLSDFVSVVNRKDVLIIQAHPFRSGMTLAREDLIDGIEVYNLAPGHNSRIGYAAKYADEMDYVCVCGSDFHTRGQAGLAALLAKKVPENDKELIRIIKEEPFYKIGNSVIIF